MDYRFARFRRGHFDGINHVAFRGEPEVLRRVRLGLCIVESAFDDGRWALAKYRPWARPIDCFSVDLQPAAHFPESRPGLLRDRTVRTGPDVNQQVSVLADDVRQLLDDGFRRFEIVVC